MRLKPNFQKSIASSACFALAIGSSSIFAEDEDIMRRKKIRRRSNGREVQKYRREVEVNAVDNKQ